jgi:hypothetical protein
MEWFWGLFDDTRQAVSAWPIGPGERPNRLGARKQQLRHSGKSSWSLTEAELNDAVIELLIDAKSIDTDNVIEKCASQRRDTLREHARVERTPHRLVN